uniref:Uncharacterized protein n=1 Tax=Anguilla anguilla TaxID=7936 RepID=A0A0E9S5V5_ANGAN
MRDLAADSGDFKHPQFSLQNTWCHPLLLFTPQAVAKLALSGVRGRPFIRLQHRVQGHPIDKQEWLHRLILL